MAGVPGESERRARSRDDPRFEKPHYGHRFVAKGVGDRRDRSLPVLRPRKRSSDDRRAPPRFPKTRTSTASPVNIVSDNFAFSAPSEGLVADTVRSLASASASGTFEDPSEQPLKAIEEPGRVLAVRQAT